MTGLKILNEYATAIPGPLYEQTPKAVLAAIVVSLLSCGGDRMEDVEEGLRAEWEALHVAGIVPQKPPKR